MYGKHFASMYTGSMYGAGPAVFAVWGYVIAHAVDSTVELNPRALADIIGAPLDDIAEAIATLCAPDPASRNKAFDGCRLLKEGEYAYRIPSHAHYRAIKNEDERREYNRQKKAEQRGRESKPVKARVNDSQGMSAHTEAETDTKAKAVNGHTAEGEDHLGLRPPTPRTAPRVSPVGAVSKGERGKNGPQRLTLADLPGKPSL